MNMPFHAPRSFPLPHLHSQGIIPLGGCKVESTKRGPKGASFGIKVTHPDFAAGKLLILACEAEDDARGWERALADCSRVTMENALLGDSMIEKLRSEGTAAEAEKSATLQRLGEATLKLKLESEEKLELLANQESVLAAAKDADVRCVSGGMGCCSQCLLPTTPPSPHLTPTPPPPLQERAARKEAEMAGAVAEAEQRRARLEEEAARIQAEIEARAGALRRANDEFDSLSARPEGGVPGALKPAPGMEARAALLMEEKSRLEKEKLALERAVRDMKLSLDSSEGARRALEAQLEHVGKEEGDLAKERAMREALERKLAAAEASLQRLNMALRKGGVTLPDDVFADVKMLMQFFEERTEEARLDAHRIELMKGALAARKSALLAATAEGASAASVAALPPEAFMPAAPPKAAPAKTWMGALGFGGGKGKAAAAAAAKAGGGDGDDSGGGGSDSD